MWVKYESWSLEVRRITESFEKWNASVCFSVKTLRVPFKVSTCVLVWGTELGTWWCKETLGEFHWWQSEVSLMRDFNCLKRFYWRDNSGFKVFESKISKSPQGTPKDYILNDRIVWMCGQWTQNHRIWHENRTNELKLSKEKWHKYIK